MQMAFFQIPARPETALQEELNVFLRSHRVLKVHREFVAQGDNSFWALGVEYLEGRVSPRPGQASGVSGRKPRVDYREVLSPADFAVFAKLRDWRKEAAAAETTPVYTIFTNEQLANVATTRPENVAQLQEVEGIGEAKAEKYGEGLIEVVQSSGGSRSAATGHETDTGMDEVELVPPGVGTRPAHGGSRSTATTNGADTGMDGVEAVPPGGGDRMRRTGEIHELIAERENLRLAFWKATRGKRARPEVIAFARFADTDGFRKQVLRRFGRVA